MKILAIRGEGLASLARRFEVVLDAAPLRDAGVFAIVGPTGAGKSTLLDAVCLALYDRTPRLLGRGTRIETGGDERESIASGDPRNVLRKGASRGWAEVDFRGIDGKIWRARWEVRRARGGRLKDAVITLSDRETGRLEGGHRKGEVLAEIEARLGLTFSQFQRAVLLAQGRFAAFLEADDRERAELLERMTGTEVYGRISMEVARRAKDERRALERLDERLASLMALTDDERDACEREIPVRRLEAARAEERVRALDEHARWYVQLDVSAAELVDAERTLSELERQLSLAEPKRREVEEARVAEPVRAPLEAHDLACEAHRVQEAAFERARLELSRAHDALTRARSEYELARSKEKEAAQAYSVLEPAIREARRFDHEIAMASERARVAAHTMREGTIELERAEYELAELARQREALEQARCDARARRASHGAFDAMALGDIARLRERLERLSKVNEALSRAMRDHSRSKETLDAASERALRGEERVRALEGELLRADHEVHERRAALDRSASTDALRRAIERMSGVRDSVLAAMHASVSAQTARSAAQEQLSSMERAQAAADASERHRRESAAERERARAMLTEAERARDLARATFDLANLRRELAHGEPCPLCGSKEHPYVHDMPARLADELEARVRQLRAMIPALDGEVARAEATLAAERRAEDEALRARQAQLEESARATERVSLALSAANQSISESFPASDSELQAVMEAAFCEWSLVRRDPCSRALEALIGRVDVARERLFQMSAERDALDRTVMEAMAVREGASSRLEEVRKAEYIESKTLESLRGQIAIAERDVERWSSERGELLEGLAAARGALDSYAGPLDVLDGARLSSLEGALEAHELARRDEEAITARLSSTDLEESQLRASHERRSSVLERAERTSEELRLELEALRARRDALVHGDVEVVHAEALRGLEVAREARAEHARILASIDAEVLVMTRAEREAAHDFAQASSRERDARARLDEALLAARLDERVARPALGRSAREIEGYREELAHLDAQRASQRAVVEERRRRREAHEAHPPSGLAPRDALSHERTNAKDAFSAAKTRLIRIEERLLSDDRVREERAHVETQIEAQRERVRTWGTLDALIGSADGKRFRVFAQGLTLELLLEHANLELESLAPRYELRRAPGKELAILVIDRDMGDEVRGIKSLSGGETFLVSLALALALGSITARRVPVHSLFIDEGFGGLDGESLEIALAALETLRASGRQVGVVSHVAALSERFGARVEVHPRGHAESEVRVVSAGDFILDA